MSALFNGQKANLKYLWIAEFSDGSVFSEPADDHSNLDPKKSAFYDLLQMIQSGKILTKFTIKSRGILPNFASVSLLDGSFSINGSKIYLDNDLPVKIKREVIFYRQHEQSTTVSFSTVQGKEVKMSPATDHLRYTIGWKTNIGGKSFEHTLAVE